MAGRIYLTRQVPVLVQPGRPAPLRVGRPVPHLRGTAVPPGTPAPALKLWSFLYYTFNEGNPNDFASCSGSTMLKGLNWNLWRTVLRQMVTNRGGNPDAEVVETGTTVKLEGQVNLDLARCCNVVALGHSPPKAHVDWIKANSTASGGTKVLTGLQNYESVAQYPELNEILEPERLVGRTYAASAALTSGCFLTGLNRYLCTCIDQYERQDSGVSSGSWPCGGVAAYPAGIVACPHTPAHGTLPPNATVFGKHTWDTRVSVQFAALTTDLIAAMQARLDGNYIGNTKYVLDGCMYDNMKMFRTFVPADGPTNVHVAAEIDNTQYNNGWRHFATNVMSWAAGRPQVITPEFFYWANASDQTTVYSVSDVKNRWVEFFFVSIDGSSPRLWAGAGGIQEALQRAKTQGLRIVLGNTGTFREQQKWAETSGGPNPATNGTWAQIVAQVASLDAWDNVYAQCARQTSGGYIYWQEGWVEPRAVA